MGTDRDPLAFRDRRLVLGIIGVIYEADRPVPWSEILDTFTTDKRPYRTVEATLYDLIAYGAIHRVGQPSRKRGAPDTRGLKPTPLGRAWVDREAAAWPWPDEHDDGPA